MAVGPHKNLCWVIRLIIFLGLVSLQNLVNDMVFHFAAGEYCCSWFVYVFVGWGLPQVINGLCYFGRNFSNSEKALKPDGCQWPYWGKVVGKTDRITGNDMGWTYIMNIA